MNERMTLAFITALYTCSSIQNRSVDTYFYNFEMMLLSGIHVFLYIDEQHKTRAEKLLNYYPHLTILGYIKLDTSWVPKNIILPKERSQTKDTLEYFCIQLSKLKLLADASMKISSKFTHMAWIDFGIFHMFKDRPRMIRALQTLSTYELESNKVWAPGGWLKAGNYELWDKPCWCHSGSIIVSDRNLIKDLYEKQTKLVNENLPKITWEINYWTMMGDVFTRYKGEHNDGILLGFPIQWPSYV